MKNKRLPLAALALALLFLAGGCQLAREDAGEARESGRLIGVLVTFEPLDGKIALSGASQSQGRLYASLTQRALTDEETKETHSLAEYAFDSVRGLSMLAPTMFDSETGDPYTAISADGGITGGKTNLSVRDNEETLSLEGAVYVAPSQNAAVYYVNPVYQIADGRVYAASGNGITLDADSVPGVSFSTTLSSSTQETGKKQSAAVALTFVVMLPPEEIVLIQMDEANRILSRTAFLPGQTPKIITPEAGAAYLIVETRSHYGSGAAAVSRRLVNEEESGFDSFYCREDGICASAWTELDWPGAEN